MWSNFCIKLKENANRNLQKVKMGLQRECVSRAHVFRCNKAFLDGHEIVEDKPPSGRTCMSKMEENVTKVRALMRSDRRLTVRMIGTIVRSLNDSKKGFIVSGQTLQTLG